MSTQHTSADLVQRGRAALEAYRAEDARAAFEQAIALDRDCLDAYVALADLRFPGDDYYAVLAHLHQALRPQTYVEIGIETGASMALALPGTRCVGIDPAPRLTARMAVTPQIYALESGAFFARHDLKKILGAPVELGFIDGLHAFEQVLDDFINLEEACARGATLAIHDCIPFDELTASRTRQTKFWTGDVWRILPALARYRPDLTVAAVACGPSGLGLVRGLDSSSRVLANQRDEIVKFGLALPFSASRTLPSFGVRMVMNDWGEIERQVLVAN